MLGYFFIFSLFLKMSFATDALGILWEQEDEETEEETLFMRSLRGEPLSDVENNLMIRRLSHLPFTDHLKTNSWHKIVRYRSVRSMDVSDWQKYQPLIPYIPASLLRQVNFSDSLILSYFGRQEFKENRLSHLAEEVTESLGNVLNSKENIMMLGNIICGFPPGKLTEIEKPVLSTEHLTTLVNQLMKYKVLSTPRTWRSETVRQAGSLIAGLPVEDLLQIRGETFSQISPKIIDLIPSTTLKKFRNSQVKHFPTSSLLSWRRKTQDLRSINGSSYFAVGTSFISILVAFVLVT